MLTVLHPSRRGFTVIEAMVTLVILGVLIALGAPTIGTWLSSARVRSTAEATLTGLQYARSEAASRNQSVRFQLTSTLDSSCALSNQGLNWVVDLVEPGSDDSVEGQCNVAASDATPPAPGILQKRSASETSGITQVQASQAAVVFNGLGRLVPTPAGNVTIDITPANAADCRGAGGEVTCLRVFASPAGQVKMCNPDPNLLSSDPRKCP